MKLKQVMKAMHQRQRVSKQLAFDMIKQYATWMSVKCTDSSKRNISIDLEADKNLRMQMLQNMIEKKELKEIVELQRVFGAWAMFVKDLKLKEHILMQIT